MHGSTMHGEQSRDPDDALDPWTYYRRSGPVGDVFDALERSRRISPPRPHRRRGPGHRDRRRLRQTGQSLTYFEIDAAVRQIAQDPEYFTYLTNCQVDAADPHGRCPADAGPTSPTASSTCC